MIAFKYTKTDGAEYLSHLDLLRHIDRTLRRAGIAVKTSGGFHPHPKIFMNNPLGLGVKSVAEYCAVDTDFNGDFKSAFNENSPSGVKCLDFLVTADNPNYANTITGCTYSADCAPFDAQSFLAREEIIIRDRRDRTVDIKPRILALSYKDGKAVFTLGCGQNNLRPDLFCDILAEFSGEKLSGLIKIASHGEFTF